MRREKSIVISFESGAEDPEDADKRSFSWTLSDINTDFLEFDFTFKYPLYISQGEKPDTLVVEFKKNELYMTPENKFLDILPNNFKVPITLPPQQIKVSALVGDVKPEEQVEAFMIVQFMLTSVLNISAQNLIGMVNSLQITSHLPLNNVQFVYPCRATFDALIEVTSFDFLPGEIYEGMKMTPTDYWSPEFDFLGYDTTNFLEQM